MIKCCFIIVLILLFHSFIFGQIEHKSKINWIEYESQVSDSLKIEYLKLMKSNQYVNTEYIWKKQFFDKQENYDHFFQSEVKKFHLIDINNDSLLDVIYEGRMPVGIEQNDIVMFIRSNDSLEIVLKIMGIFEKILINNNRLDSMVIVVEPCCAGFSYKRSWYSFTKLHNSKLCKSDILTENNDGYYGYAEYFNEFLPCYLNEQEMYGYFYDDNKPKDQQRISFIALKNFYLTFAPEELSNVDIDEQADISYLFEGNNQIGLFKKGANVFVIATKTGENGMKYALVRINNNDKIKSIFGKSELFIYGWTEISNLIN